MKKQINILLKKKEIEKHKVKRRHWPNAKEFRTAVFFHFLTPAGVGGTFSFLPHPCNLFFNLFLKLNKNNCMLMNMIPDKY